MDDLMISWHLWLMLVLLCCCGTATVATTFDDDVVDVAKETRDTDATDAKVE